MAAQRQALSTGKMKIGSISQQEEEKRRLDWISSLERAGIYERYINCNLNLLQDNPGINQADKEKILQFNLNLKQHLKKGEGLILRGPVGTGKTTVAVAVLINVLKLNGYGLFVSMASLLDNIFTLKEQNKQTWLDYEYRLKNVGLLVIDDLGAEYKRDWVLNKFDAIISERYNRCRSTIITSNLGIKDMQGTYANRVMDRLRSTCLDILFKGKSLRENAG
jgi:DNA replication protein DnaC